MTDQKELEACVTELKKHLAPCHAEYGLAIVKSVVGTLDAYRANHNPPEIPLALVQDQRRRIEKLEKEKEALERTLTSARTCQANLEIGLKWVLDNILLGEVVEIDTLNYATERVETLLKNPEIGHATGLTGLNPSLVIVDEFEQDAPQPGAPEITGKMKYECIGEFSFNIDGVCPECDDDNPDPDCEICAGEYAFSQPVTVPWDTCKDIYKAMALSAQQGKE